MEPKCFARGVQESCIFSLFMNAEDFPCLGLEGGSTSLRQYGQSRLAFY